MNLNDKIQSMRLNLEIFSNPSVMKQLAIKIMNFLDAIQDEKFVFVRTQVINGNSFPLNLVILQFQCDPPKILGMVLLNHIYHVFVKSEELVKKFNGIVIQLLHLLQDSYIFFFGNQGLRFIKQILPFKAKDMQPQPSVEFLHKLKILNVQLRNDEGIIPALFSIRERPYNDIIPKDVHDMNLFFKRGQIDRILEHNTSHLLSILKLVKTRFLKLALW